MSDEKAIFVLILALLDRVVNADGVDTCDPRLHLTLAVMDSRLIIYKLAGQMQRRTAPI